jgi:MFS family permease
VLPLPSRGPRTPVRRLALARLLSTAGTDASAVALGWAMYAQTGSAAWLSLSLLITIGGGSVLAPLAGWVGDRVDRRRVLLSCELTSAALFTVLALVHTPWAMLALSVLATASGAIFGPAAGAAMGEIAGERDLAWANGLVATGANLGRTAGRLAGGVLVAVLGAGAVFALDAVTFLASAALIASVRVPFSARASAPDAPLARGLGLRELWASPVLRLLTASACISTFVTSVSMTAEVPLVVALGAGPIGLGALAAAWGLGMAVGSWHAGRALHAGNEATGVLVGRAAMAVGLGLVAAVPLLPAAVACYVLGGVGGGFMGVAAQSLIVRRTPDALRARLLAAVDGCRNLAFGAGVLAAGVIVELLGPRPVYALVGAGVLVGCAPVAALVRQLGGPRALRPATAR